MSNSVTAHAYTCSQVKQIEQTVINKHDIPGIVLMKRAGRAVYQALHALWPQTKNLVVFCGGGNNGGDGYIVAALAQEKNVKAIVYALVDPNALKGDAHTAFEYAKQAGVNIVPFGQAEQYVDSHDTVIVDALLGTGLQGAVRSDYRIAIDQINQSGLPVMSVDIPSGLAGDTGTVVGCCVKADATMTFIAHKIGLLTGQGPSYGGKLLLDHLGAPTEAIKPVSFAAEVHGGLKLSYYLPSRAQSAYKNQFGHVMVIGGDVGMGGAAILSAQAAARCGAGLVSVATQPVHVAAVLSRVPEVMTLGVPSGQELEPHLAKPTVLAVGPGLGQSPWSEQMLQQALNRAAQGGALVLDADALNLLALGKLKIPDTVGQVVITPHVGEAARLLGGSAEEIEQDRMRAALNLSRQYNAVVVLKGAGSIVCGQQGTAIVTDGNPGMATGGCGDVLTGVIAALMAQGLSAFDAALCGTSMHGQAGDLAAEAGQRGLVASDLIPHLRSIANL